MGRPRKSEKPQVEEEKIIVEQQPETEEPGEIEEAKTTPKKDVKADEVSPRDMELMRLYPQYEKIWITPDGFVHPYGAPDYLLAGAKLYTNTYYNK